MSSRYRSVLALLAGVVVLAAVITPGALAGKPTMERVDLDEVFFDDFLTAECGVDVTTHIQGHIILRTFADGRNIEVNTISFALTAMAGDNTYQFRDVGVDHVQVTKDGTEIISIVGQVPFEFIGALKINLTTGEVIHEPGHDISGRLAEACAALTA
jgi:hypothetical protein